MSLRASVGGYSDAGGRPYQQDAWIVQEGILGPNTLLMAVLDGHGSEGDKCAQFLKSIIPEIICEHASELMAKPEDTFKTVFAALNASVHENCDTYLSGTTCTIALMWQIEEDKPGSTSAKRRLAVAHVGDSRAVLGLVQDASAIPTPLPITRDHNLLDKEELSRVQAAGGRVERLTAEDGPAGPLRVFKGTLPYPGIATTRTLGDAVAQKLGVIPEPEVFVKDVDSNARYLVLASDGVWDGLDNADVDQITSDYWNQYQDEGPPRTSEKPIAKADTSKPHTSAILPLAQSYRDVLLKSNSSLVNLSQNSKNMTQFPVPAPQSSKTSPSNIFAGTDAPVHHPPSRTSFTENSNHNLLSLQSNPTHASVAQLSTTTSQAQPQPSPLASQFSDSISSSSPNLRGAITKANDAKISSNPTERSKTKTRDMAGRKCSVVIVKNALRGLSKKDLDDNVTAVVALTW